MLPRLPVSEDRDVTVLVSIFGFAGRMAGDLLTTALGWAGNLLFGRVPRSHQMYVVVMMALSFLWLLVTVAVLIPSLASLMLSTTPHPASFSEALLRAVLLVAVVVLPPAVGLVGHFVPADGQRDSIGALVVDLLRGFVLAPLIAAFLLFLAGVGIVRKARSGSRGWTDAHVAVVIEPDGYDEVVDDLDEVLERAGLPVDVKDAPAVLTFPARVLSAVANRSVSRMRAERIVELRGRNLRIGVNPSDIAISGKPRDVTRARAAILGRLPSMAAHQTTSAEAQRLEDALAKVTDTRPARRGQLSGAASAELDEIDRRLLALEIPTDEWDILYRLRLQVERDLLAGTDVDVTAEAPAVAR
jgi:hypothetical protein